MGESAAAQRSEEKSRLDVAECEEEIKTIKNALRTLVGGDGGASGGPPSNNRLEVSVMVPSSGSGVGGDGTTTNGDPKLRSTFLRPSRNV